MGHEREKQRDGRTVGIVMGRHAPVKRDEARRMRRAMTPAEAALWDALRANRLAGLHFRRQQVIDGFIADFYCHAAQIIVEVDGDIHGAATAYDAERDRILTARGLRVLRFTNERVARDLPACLHEILRAAQDEDTHPLPESGRGPGG